MVATGSMKQDEQIALGSLVSAPSHVPLRVAVHERLKDAIRDGVLKPGHALSENWLADQFQVSRTPVREALRMLEREGLVSVLPGRKLVVSLPSAQDIDDIYGIRIIVETAAIRGISADDAKTLARLEACIAGADARPGDADGSPLAQPGDDFHMTLIATLGNRRLQQFVNSIHDEVDRLRRYSLEDADWAARAAADHVEIIGFLKQGRNDEAARVLTRHLEQANETIKRRFHARAAKQ